MKRDKINYSMVGLFVMTSMLLLFYILIKITGMQTDNDMYFAHFKNVSGVKSGSSVTYGGYKIGQIESIEPVFVDGVTKFKVMLKVRKDWPIPDNSVAEVTMPGVVADKLIEITEGNSKNLLKPGDVINSKASVDLAALASDLGNEVTTMLAEVSNGATGLLTKLIKSADHISSILSDKNIMHIEKMFRNADEATMHLVKLSKGFDRVNTQLDIILSKSIAMVDDNDQDIRHSVIELKKTMDVVSENMHSILYNLDASSRNMNEFTRQIRDNPSSILGSKAPIDESEAHK